MSDLGTRIRKVTEELRGIQADFEAASTQNLDLRTAIDLPLLQELKAALDHARHAVWPQVLAFEQKLHENVLYALQLYRMHRIREMLKVLQQDESSLGEDARLRLFLAEIHRMTSRSSDS